MREKLIDRIIEISKRNNGFDQGLMKRKNSTLIKKKIKVLKRKNSTLIKKKIKNPKNMKHLKLLKKKKKNTKTKKS